MNKYSKILLSIVLSLNLVGCLEHGNDPKSTPIAAQPAGVGIQKGMAVYVSATNSATEKLDGTTDFIAAQVAKILAPVAGSTTVGKEGEEAAALQEAKKHNSSYLVLLNVYKWQNAFFFSPSAAKIDIAIYDAQTGVMLRKDAINAQCNIVPVGSEHTARACVRPQIESWAAQVFAQNAPGSNQ